MITIPDHHAKQAVQAMKSAKAFSPYNIKTALEQGEANLSHAIQCSDDKGMGMSSAFEIHKTVTWLRRMTEDGRDIPATMVLRAVQDLESALKTSPLGLTEIRNGKPEEWIGDATRKLTPDA